MGLTRFGEGTGNRIVISGSGRAQPSSHPTPHRNNYCPAVTQPVRTSFCLNGKRNPVLVAPGVFVETFGDVSREASVLSLEVSQGLQWSDFPQYTPLPACQVVFHPKAALVWKRCLLRAYYVSTDIFWAPGSA